MAIKLNPANVVTSTIAAKRPTKDAKDHSATSVLPMIVLPTNDAKGFATAVATFIAACTAIKDGQEVTIVRANGSEVTATPTDTIHFDSKAAVPNTLLPLSYTDLADAINDALAAAHRNRMGAALTKEFTVPSTKKAAKAAGVADDLEF